MTNIEKNLRAKKVVGILTAIAAAIVLTLRILLAIEKNSIKGTIVSIIISGGKSMSRSKYLSIASIIGIVLTVVFIVLLIVSIANLVSYSKKKKKLANLTEQYAGKE